MAEERRGTPVLYDLIEVLQYDCLHYESWLLILLTKFNLFSKWVISFVLIYRVRPICPVKSSDL
jgi:hypothetical protein